MQAPIGPAATPELAAAVSRAGGIGSLGASWTDPPLLRAQIRAVRRLTDRPVMVNLVVAFDQAERLEVACEEGVELISFSWGVRDDLVARAHAGGCRVVVQAGSVEEARAGVRAGCDAVIAQGVEAGGHVQGTAPLRALVAGVRAAVGVPVIAAGGIADAAGVRDAIGLGAAGAMLGTRFVATAEADVHPGYADRLIAATGADTVHTLLFDGGWPDAPHRVLVNSTYRRWVEDGRRAAGARPGEGEILGEHEGVPIARYSADDPRRGTTGDIEAMCLYAGTGVGAVTAVEPAAAVVERIAAGVAT